MMKIMSLNLVSKVFAGEDLVYSLGALEDISEKGVRYLTLNQMCAVFHIWKVPLLEHAEFISFYMRFC